MNSFRYYRPVSGPSMCIRSLRRGVFLLLLLNAGAFAQSNPWGSWFISTLQLPATEHGWGGFLEVQARSRALFDEFNYYEVKGGVSYDLGPNFSALIGAGRYHSYNYRELDLGPQALETRLWEQLTLSQYLDRLKFEHRYRVEQRWYGESTPEQQAIFGRFRNRVRYRLNLLIPLNADAIQTKTAFLSIYDELFLNPKSPHFERNRLYAGLGYQLSRSVTLQAGWLYQYDFAPIRTGGKNNAVISVLYRIHRKTAERERLPTQMD
ncbi:DUF2490 domain-containing protein [Larkinella soli]|uniref:DUF2490 domain-containing protein n=1 Tax=Larkinella soli TaxID=1770527 RepID=UPI001E3990B8|nr:DUF2490 domain-containing protein [Larkinella soli]